MANSPQAIKRARQAKKHNEHNRSLRSKMRTLIKQVLATVQTSDHKGAMEAYKACSKYIDSMVNKNIVHKNAAARYKSRLNARVKAVA